MSDFISSNKSLIFSIYNEAEKDYICKLGRALSIRDRVDILHLLQYKPMNLLEISKKLNLPVSSVSNHIDALADAQLIFINYQPGRKGHVKMCSKMVYNASVLLGDPPEKNSPKHSESFEMPVGQFTACRITAPCGMASSQNIIHSVDNPNVFFVPERTEAQLLWFNEGFVSYDFPNHFLKNMDYSKISISFEMCSESIYYREIWPSDITIKINDIKITTFLSPGDFGGRKGKFTPDYWGINSTQYGLLKKFMVDEKGVYIDEVLDNTHLNIGDLHLSENNSIKLSICIEEDAVHKGGINIFGKGFGDYQQAIVMTVE